MSSRLIPARWRASLLANLTGPARWWHFWRPGSGLIGGLIAGALLSAYLLWAVFVGRIVIEYTPAYMLVALAFLVGLTIRDPDMRLYEASWAVVFWPLTVLLVAVVLLLRLLSAVGLHVRFGRPKPGLGWSVARVRPRDPAFPHRVIGVWVATPWRALSVWWVSPWKVRRP